MFFFSSVGRLREYFYSVVSDRPEQEKYAATIFQHSIKIMFKYQDMIIIITLIACTVCVYIYLVYLRKVDGAE